MATQFINSNAGATAHHLGLIGSPYLQKFGLSADSNYVALRACTRAVADQDGDVMLPMASFSGADAVGNKALSRAYGDPNYTQVNPQSFQNLSLRMLDQGCQHDLDLNTPNNRMVYRLQGMAGLDRVGVSAALAMYLQKIETTLLTLLTAGTSPFTANADVDCSGTDWTQSSTAIDTQILTAIEKCQATGFTPDAVILDHTAARHFRHSPEIVTRYGGNAGAGALSTSLYQQAWASYGITQIFTCLASSALGDKVILFKRGAAFTEGDNVDAGALLAFQQPPIEAEQDEYGLTYFEGVQGAAGVVKTYGVRSTLGYVINPQLGVRLTAAY